REPALEPCQGARVVAGAGCDHSRKHATRLALRRGPAGRLRELIGVARLKLVVGDVSKLEGLVATRGIELHASGLIHDVAWRAEVHGRTPFARATDHSTRS